MKRSLIAEAPQPQPEGAPEGSAQGSPANPNLPAPKWRKSSPIYGTRSVAEVITSEETGVRILVVTDLRKGSRPRKFPLAAIDLDAMRKPLPQESPEILEILQIAADSGRVILKSRETQAQERHDQPQERQGMELEP